MHLHCSAEQPQPPRMHMKSTIKQQHQWREGTGACQCTPRRKHFAEECWASRQIQDLLVNRPHSYHFATESHAMHHQTDRCRATVLPKRCSTRYYYYAAAGAPALLVQVRPSTVNCDPPGAATRHSSPTKRSFCGMCSPLSCSGRRHAVKFWTAAHSVKTCKHRVLCGIACNLYFCRTVHSSCAASQPQHYVPAVCQCSISSPTGRILCKSPHKPLQARCI